MGPRLHARRHARRREGARAPDADPSAAVHRLRRPELTGVPTVAACLIVRDGLPALPRLLASVRPFVDEVAIFDTGSTDGTLEYLEQEQHGDGATLAVVRGEWRDDFGWAREQSFALASERMDWLLCVDADDELVGGEELRAVLAEGGPEVDGLFVYYDYARDASGQTTQANWLLRCVRRDAGFHWRGVVHENLIREPEVGGRLATAPADRLRVVHHREGIGDPYRNLRLLRAELAREEALGEVSPRTLFDLGREFAFWGEFDDASVTLQRFLDAAWGPPDLRSHATHLLAGSLRIVGRVADAIAIELESDRARPGSTETALGLAESYAAGRQWSEAERWALVAVERGLPRSSLPMNPARLRIAPRLVLARALVARGALEEARSWLESTADERLLQRLDAADDAGAAAAIDTAIVQYDEMRAAAVRSLAAGRDLAD